MVSPGSRDIDRLSERWLAREGTIPEGGLFKLLAVAAVVMGIAHTVAKERLFAPLRRKLGGKRTWLGFLVSCPYCLSHWIAFIVVPLTGAYYLSPVPGLGWFGDVLRWFFSSILVVVVAAFLRVAFYFIDESQGLLRRREMEEDIALEKLREELTREHRHRRAPSQPGVASSKDRRDDPPSPPATH